MWPCAMNGNITMVCFFSAIGVSGDSGDDTPRDTERERETETER